MKTIKTRVCVLGAGAGGTGAVYRLIKNGIKTTVIDKYPDFGGTSVFCGVDGWEPGVTLDGLHLLLKDELEKMDKACHVIEVVPNCNLFNPENGLNWDNHSFKKYPWGLSLPMGKTYEDVYKCCKLYKTAEEKFNRFQFEPDAMRTAINNVFAPYKENLTTFFGCSFKESISENGKIIAIIIENDEDTVKIEADYFVEATGDIILARDAGCQYSFGSDGNEYNEPCGGEKDDNVNGVSYIFRVGRVDDSEHIDPIAEEYQIDLGEWARDRMLRTISCFFTYPNGDINVNMLPTMEGIDYFKLGDKADLYGRARVYAYWNYLQREKNMQGYTLKHIYDAGVRESYRLIGKHVLTENDIRNGGAGKGRTIAIADHAVDIHGNSRMSSELEKPYEVPLECTMTNEYENLFVASRGASFSHVAQSSVRLVRTIMSIGEGVGEYISEII